jgi:hypothetical protein
MSNVQLNVILVGSENFQQDDRRKVTTALAVMRQIYLGIGLHFAIDRFALSAANLRGRHMSPLDEADLTALTRLAGGPDGTIDIFVVKIILGYHGLSPIRGPCDKRRKGMKGVVVATQTPIRSADPSVDADTFRGRVWAHEVGHYLGLEHCPCNDLPCLGNVMRGAECSPSAGTALSSDQANTIAGHCAVTA